MAVFTASIRDSSGTRRTVRRMADDAAGCAAQLRAEGCLVLDVSEEKASVDEALPPWHPAGWRPMTGFDVEMGLRQLALLLKSGVTLVEALAAVSEQSRSPRASRVWRRVADRIIAGDSFSCALAAQGRRFGEMILQLARVGEQAGELDLVLRRAADHLEARRNLRALVLNALAYPALALTLALGVTAFLVTAVIPRIASFLEAGGARLPPMTQFLVDVSDVVLRRGPAACAVFAAMLAGAWAIRRTRRGREIEDALLLHVPVVGRILRLASTALLARAMETLLASGVSLLEALQATSRLLANARLRRRLENAHDAVMRGMPFAEALRAAPEILPMFARLAAVGEMTGAMVETFGETARYHETLLAVAIRRFGVWVEPVVICFTGLVVGFVYVAFFTALFALAGAV